jgi:O-antigen ligase
MALSVADFLNCRLRNRLVPHALGLLFLLPFTYHRGSDPLPNFSHEWSAFFLGTTAILLFLLSYRRRRLSIPKIAALPAAMTGIILAETFLRSQSIVGDQRLVALYLLWSSLIMIVTYNAARTIGVRSMIQLLSGYLLCGALWNLGVEAYSLGQDPLQRKLNGFMLGIGAIGQHNHISVYLFMALCSASYLCALSRIRIGLFLITAWLITLELVFTGSRSVFVLILAGALLSTILNDARHTRIFRTLRRLWLYISVFFIVNLLIFMQMQPDWFPTNGQSYDAFSRSMDSATPSRLAIWRIAWICFLEHPWLGWGINEFDWAFFLHAPQSAPIGIGHRMEHAHNLFMALLTDTGIIGFLCAATLLLNWLWQTIRRPAASGLAFWWLSASIFTLGWHNMIEYPLWQGHFLGLFSVIAAISTREHYALPFSKLTRHVWLPIPAYGFWLLALIGNDFLKLERFYEAFRQHKPIPAAPGSLVPICADSLLQGYCWKYFVATRPLSSDDTDNMSELSRLAVHFEPIPVLAYYHAIYLALNGNQDQAQAFFRLAATAYPALLPTIRAQIHQLPEGDQQVLLPILDAL